MTQMMFMVIVRVLFIAGTCCSIICGISLAMHTGGHELCRSRATPAGLEMRARATRGTVTMRMATAASSQR